MTPKRFEWPAGQLDGERSRLVVKGRRVDDHTLCTLVIVHEIGGTWALFPHGWGRFGVRLAHAEAAKIARRILGLEGEDR